MDYGPYSKANEDFRAVAWRKGFHCPFWTLTSKAAVLATDGAEAGERLGKHHFLTKIFE